MAMFVLPDPPVLMASSSSASQSAPRGRWPDGWDQRWFLDVNAFARHTPWLHPVMTAYVTYGIGLFVALLLVGWQIARRDGRVEAMGAALWAPLGALAAVIINQPIVDHVAEPRPYVRLSQILVLTHRSNDFSFPSDHATMAGAVAAGLLLLNRRLGLIATLAALAMAFGRIYVGAHYPTDVIAGLILGATIALAGHTAADPGLRWILARLRASPLRPLLTASPSDATDGPAPSDDPPCPDGDSGSDGSTSSSPRAADTDRPLPRSPKP